MAQSKLKQKTIDQERSKSRFSPGQSQRQSAVEKLSRQESELKNIQTFWSEEIEGITKQSFTSVEQATEALIDRVLDRMQEKGKERETLKVFLSDLFATDPQIQEEIRAILKC